MLEAFDGASQLASDAGAGLKAQAAKKPSALDEIFQKGVAAKEAAKAKPVDAPASGEETPWLQPGIVVKIVSKALQSEGLYKRKGVVRRCLQGGYVAEIDAIDTDARVQVDQAELETVLPSVGGAVVVLKGEHRGLTGKMDGLETDKYKAVVTLREGPGKGMTITVEHIWKGVLWGKARGVSEHGGMLVCRSRDVKIHGGRAKDPVTGGRGFGAVPMSPGSALLRSPSNQDNGGPQAAPQRGRFGGGAVGRRDAGLIGSNVKVTAGVYKGYKGKVVDATETTVRVELQAQGRTVTVQRTQIAQPGAAPVASSYGAAPTASSVDSSFQPPARTPQHRPTTPAYNPGMTPSRDDGAGGRTPLRDTAWGAQTPAYDTSHWNDDTPTPGGESGYTGTPDVRHTGTPDLRGGSSALAISASDAGYRGKFITGAVVVLPGGKQGVVRSRSGDEVTVQIGTLKTLPNGETRMESLEGDERETVSEAELELAKPQKKDKIIVVEGTDRGLGAELIGVDNEDGVIKMDATKEISIYGIGTLARIFVG